MADIEYTVLDLVKSSNEKNAIEFNKAVSHILQTKATQAIERKREELAANMFNNEKDEDESDLDDDLDDADIEIDDIDLSDEDDETEETESEEDVDDTDNKED